MIYPFSIHVILGVCLLQNSRAQQVPAIIQASGQQSITLYATYYPLLKQIYDASKASNGANGYPIIESGGQKFLGLPVEDVLGAESSNGLSQVVGGALPLPGGLNAVPNGLSGMPLASVNALPGMACKGTGQGVLGQEQPTPGSAGPGSSGLSQLYLTFLPYLKQLYQTSLSNNGSNGFPTLQAGGKKYVGIPLPNNPQEQGTANNPYSLPGFPQMPFSSPGFIQIPIFLGLQQNPSTPSQSPGMGAIPTPGISPNQLTDMLRQTNISPPPLEALKKAEDMFGSISKSLTNSTPAKNATEYVVKTIKNPLGFPLGLAKFHPVNTTKWLSDSPANLTESEKLFYSFLNNSFNAVQFNSSNTSKVSPTQQSNSSSHWDPSKNSSTLPYTTIITNGSSPQNYSKYSSDPSKVYPFDSSNNKSRIRTDETISKTPSVQKYAPYSFNSNKTEKKPSPNNFIPYSTSPSDKNNKNKTTYADKNNSSQASSGNHNNKTNPGSNTSSQSYPEQTKSYSKKYANEANPSSLSDKSTKQVKNVYSFKEKDAGNPEKKAKPEHAKKHQSKKHHKSKKTYDEDEYEEIEDHNLNLRGKSIPPAQAHPKTAFITKPTLSKC